MNRETNEKVAIKKIQNAFENRVDALRTLRELKLLRHLHHDNVIALKDIMMPVHRSSFKDVYLVYELMDTDLHQIIKSSQSLSNDHCQYFLFQVRVSDTIAIIIENYRFAIMNKVVFYIFTMYASYSVFGPASLLSKSILKSRSYLLKLISRIDFVFINHN